MSDVKSFQELLSELKVFLKAWNRNLDTGDNSLIKDLILTPYSIGGSIVMDQVGIARDLHILSKLTGSDLDNEGTNYSLERNSGIYATVNVTFWTETAPTTDITIPAGTEVSTIGTTFANPVEFTTVAEATYALSAISNYYSYDRARYEFTVRCICSEIGSRGNVAAGLLLRLNSVVAGIDGCINLTAATGGDDEESDDDFRNRIRLKKTGRELNTVNGLRAFVKDLGFTDAYPVRPESADAEKAYGIDVFVIDSSSESFTDSFTYDPAQDEYYFTKRPIISVTSVVGSIVGTLPSTDYSVHADSTSPLRRSVESNDYIRFLPSASLTVGETVTVVYTYNSRIVQGQNTLDLNDNDILTSDPLLKRAYPLGLYINAKLNLKANADGPTTRNRVKSALSQYLGAYRLGDDIQKSDLIIILQTGYGDYPITSVDSVIINSYYLQDEYGTVYNPVDEIISVGDKYYVIFGSATII